MSSIAMKFFFLWLGKYYPEVLDKQIINSKGDSGAGTIQILFTITPGMQCVLIKINK